MITVYGQPEGLEKVTAMLLATMAKEFEPPVFVVIMRGLEAGAVLANDPRAMQELRASIIQVIDGELDKHKAKR